MKNVLMIKVLIVLFVGMNIKSSDPVVATSAVPDKVRSDELVSFLEFIRQGKESKKPFCKICNVIQAEMSTYFGGEIFDESMLSYALEVLRRRYRDQASALEEVLTGESEHLIKCKKAQERKDRAFLIKEEKEYLARGGGSDDSSDIRMKNLYPMLCLIVDIYHYSHDAYGDLFANEIIKSKADCVSIFRYLDAKISEGKAPMAKNPCVDGAPRHAYLVNIILENFPKKTDLCIERAKLEQKLIFEKKETEKEESLKFESLCQQRLIAQKKVLERQKKHEKKLEKDFLRTSFLAWMLPVKARLEKQEELEKLGESVRVSYLKNIWLRWAGSIALKKEKLFEQNILMPNKNHAQLVELVRTQRASFAEVIDLEVPSSVISGSQEQSVNLTLGLLEKLQKESDRRIARIQRRQNRRELKDIACINAKHQQDVVFKKIARDSHQGLREKYFSLWQKIGLQDQAVGAPTPILDWAALPVLGEEESDFGSQLSHGSGLAEQDSSKSISWRHDPYDRVSSKKLL